ncbi:hypothetical protein [Ornithinimicrobium cryptoxanthini]|uniref:hypothetical protein n=1 Tax=Ornithinimicrobium cryptoxanthini TaxID=2934161 RepID=UPI002118948D|nr:hypothetical protein [Ornithinimicrobium cryptoxanthini]
MNTRHPETVAHTWALTLTEPLLPLQARVQAELAMRRVCWEEPAWAAHLFGGLISDQMLTLPDKDPWRRCIIGPLSFGVLLPNGTRLGSHKAFADVLDIGVDDTDAVPDSPGLTPMSETIVATGTSGQQETAAAILLGGRNPSPTQGADNLPFPKALLNPAPVYTYAVPALHWAILRRRSFGVPVDDAWLSESLLYWPHRASSIHNDKQWDEKSHASRVREERILLDPKFDSEILQRWVVD